MLNPNFLFLRPPEGFYASGVPEAAAVGVVDGVSEAAGVPSAEAVPLGVGVARGVPTIPTLNRSMFVN